MPFAPASFGRGTSRVPLSRSRTASQWIAATIFRVASGRAKNARSSAAVVRARRRPLKVADSAPDRAIVLQQAMVAEERHKTFGGEVQHLARWGGPDRRAHRREVVRQQERREVVLAKIFASVSRVSPASLPDL